MEFLLRFIILLADYQINTEKKTTCTDPMGNVRLPELVWLYQNFAFLNHNLTWEKGIVKSSDKINISENDCVKIDRIFYSGMLLFSREGYQ